MDGRIPPIFEWAVILLVVPLIAGALAMTNASHIAKRL
jgi:uncharacterized membrane protein YtjA (UPF0391 family)